MSNYTRTTGLLNYRRKTVPRYQDIRDRPTWELLGEPLYYDLRGGGIGWEYDFYVSNETPEGLYSGLLLRLGKLEGDVINYLAFEQFKGLKMSFTNYTLKSKNVVGKITVREDLRIILGDNFSIIVANGLYFQDEYNEGVTTVPSVIYCVTRATGLWSGATNVIIFFEPDGGRRTIQILRALN
jgi:hypothetical protein